LSAYVGSARRFTVQHMLCSHQISDISALSSSVVQVGLYQLMMRYRAPAPFLK